MIDVLYTRKFLDMLSKLDLELKEEAREKIELFTSRENHKILRVHKLRGSLSIYYSFSVNYKYRIVFRWVSQNSAALMAIGGHDVYK